MRDCTFTPDIGRKGIVFKAGQELKLKKSHSRQKTLDGREFSTLQECERALDDNLEFDVSDSEEWGTHRNTVRQLNKTVTGSFTRPYD